MQILDLLPPMQRIAMRSNLEDSIPTRQSLLLRLKHSEDTPGWREFFDTYWELLYNFARKAGLTDAEAQDAVQETVVQVACKIRGFNTDPARGSFKSWLLGQARWRIGDQFRARKRNARISAPAEAFGLNGNGSSDETTRTDPVNGFVDPASDPLETMWNEEWEEHVLRKALERVRGKVSVKQFQIFELHVTQGLSVKDTAKAMATTTAAVYMATSRVGRVLKREVKAIASSGETARFQAK